MSEVRVVDQRGKDVGASDQRQPPLRVLVAASGSGGHIIPALHIVRAIRAIDPLSVIEFVGSGRPLEEKLIIGNGFARHTVRLSGVKNRGVKGVLAFAFRVPLALLQVVGILRKFRPDVVVGVGGYASVLPLVVARLLGVPTWAHEAELYPGLANQVLGYFADRISVAFPETRVRGRAQVVFTGHPVRPELAQVDSASLRGDAPKRLLVLGGSQGARGLDLAVSTIAPVAALKGLQVVHQCRPEHVDLVTNSYRAEGVSAHVVSFIDDMAGAYDWADVIISRSGASSVAEIGCVNRPTIFVPYPFQQGTHQSDNAMVLVQQQKAVIVEESQPHFPTRLRETLESVLDLERFVAMKQAPYEARGLEAANLIAKGVSSLRKPTSRA
jgi:UDP-N-acetylglucosamine--N-acetylmuramyl-(pentapeptide) pyrophosphoryl-undecaprenol N-acetylglucosamine transferase